MRLIDANVLRDNLQALAYDDWNQGVTTSWADAYSEIADMVEDMPSAQPEIVACRDCIHWICHDKRCGYWNHGVKPLDWCCHAERRADE